MRILGELFKLTIAVIVGAGLVMFLNVNVAMLRGGQSGPSLELSYSELAALNLTVATVVLGGVALIIAVAAVFGFQMIRSESVSNAEERVKNELPKMVERELGRMENDGRLTKAMERAIYSGGTSDPDGNGPGPV